LQLKHQFVASSALASLFKVIYYHAQFDTFCSIL